MKWIIPVTLIGAARWMTRWWLVLQTTSWRVEWGRRKGGGHTMCSDDHWTLPRSDWTICTVVAQSPFLSVFFSSLPPSYYLVGEPDRAGDVSGRVSRCSAQTSAPCASAQWAGMGDMRLLPPCKLSLNTRLTVSWWLSTRTIRSGSTDLRGQ